MLCIHSLKDCVVIEKITSWYVPVPIKHETCQEKKRVLKHVGMGVKIYLHTCGISKQVTILYTYFRYQVRTNRHQSISITCQTRINTNILILVFVTTYMLLVIVTFALPSLVVASVIGYLSMALTISLFLLIWPATMLLDACVVSVLIGMCGVTVGKIE